MAKALLLLVSILAASAQFDCTYCRIALQSLDVWTNSEDFDTVVQKVADLVCSTKWAPSYCDDIGYPLLVEGIKAMQDRYINADYICSTVSACSFPTYQEENLSDWASKVLSDKPSSKSPTFSNSTFRFAQLTDIHVDLNYQEGSSTQCDGISCCRGGTPSEQKYSAGEWGDYKCDIPLKTVTTALNKIKEQNVDFLIWTGDIVSHDMSLTKEEKLGVIEKVTFEIMEKFKIPVYPLIGNEECYPDHQFGIKGESWLTNALDAMWENWIGMNSKTFSKFGHYSLKHKDTDLRIIAINTLACDVENFALIANATDPGEQISFLQQELSKAEQNNEAVYIIGHVPPATSSCLSPWARHYSVLVERYQNIIKGQFYGHTHSDEIRLSRSFGGHNPTSVQFIAPSLTSLSNRNPSFRIYSADSSSFEIKNYHQWRLNLAASYPGFKEVYDFLSYYNLNNLLPSTLEKLAQEMKTDELVSLKYLKNIVTGGPETKGTCDELCRADLYCDLMYDVAEDQMNCKELKETFIHEILFKLYGPWVLKL